MAQGSANVSANASTSNGVTPFAPAKTALLTVEDLDMRFATGDGGIAALDKVSFEV
jgi:hypothetical protein